SDSLYHNGGAFFTDESAAAGLRAASRAFTRFGMGAIDFDNDGLLDLYEANGRVSRRSGAAADADPYAEPNLLFRGIAPGKFQEVTPRGGTRTPIVATSRGALFGDLDNDGRVDIIVVNRDVSVTVLHNVAPGRGHWLLLRLL